MSKFNGVAAIAAGFLVVSTILSGCESSDEQGAGGARGSKSTPQPVIEVVASSFTKSLPEVAKGGSEAGRGLKEIEAQLKKPPKLTGDSATATVSKKTVLKKIEEQLKEDGLPRDARDILNDLKKRLEEAEADGFGGVPKDPAKRSGGDEELQQFLGFGAMAMVAINPALAPVAMLILTTFGGMTTEEARKYVATAEKMRSSPADLSAEDLRRVVGALPDDVQSKVDLEDMMDVWRLVQDIEKGDAKKAIGRTLLKGLDAFVTDEDVREQLEKVRAFLKLRPDQRDAKAKALLLDELRKHTPDEKKKLVVRILKFAKLHDLADKFERGEQ